LLINSWIIHLACYSRPFSPYFSTH
jgi:hypothetical protein